MEVILKNFNQKPKVIEIKGKIEEIQYHLKGDLPVSHYYSKDILILDNGLENSNDMIFIGIDKEHYFIGLTEVQIEKILKEDNYN